MKPGRELDALVAEKAMGLVNHDCPHDTAGQCAECGKWTARNYSTDIAAAWELVEKAKLFEFKQLWKESSGWIVGDYEGSRTERAVPTAPHAICLAALSAVGVTP